MCLSKILEKEIIATEMYVTNQRNRKKIDKIIEKREKKKWV